MGVTFGTWGLDLWEHEGIAASLYRPTDIAFVSGNLVKAMVKLGWDAKYIVIYVI